MHIIPHRASTSLPNTRGRALHLSNCGSSSSSHHHHTHYESRPESEDRIIFGLQTVQCATEPASSSIHDPRHPFSLHAPSAFTVQGLTGGIAQPPPEAHARFRLARCAQKRRADKGRGPKPASFVCLSPFRTLGRTPAQAEHRRVSVVGCVWDCFSVSRK